MGCGVGDPPNANKVLKKKKKFPAINREMQPRVGNTAHPLPPMSTNTLANTNSASFPYETR